MSPSSSIEFYKKYCDDIENTSAWGGQLELKALVQLLQRPITIYSATAPDVLMGEEYGDPSESLLLSLVFLLLNIQTYIRNKDLPDIIIRYHKHYYALGEHYNSVVPKTESEEGEDEGDGEGEEDHNEDSDD